MIISTTLFIFLQASFIISIHAGLISQEPLILTKPDSDPSQSYSSNLTIDTSNLLFITLASLLKQGPNSLYPNGHTIIPGTIPEGTRLYHGLNNYTLAPDGMEWLGFEPEMSYSIHSRRPGGSTLLTYRATRPLRVIYFDGQSASLGPAGYMDSQTAIIKGDVPIEFPTEDFLMGEYQRGEELCQLGIQFGFEGVVRMNTGFELIWCNFQIGIELISSTNITASFMNDEESLMRLRKRAAWEWIRSIQRHYHQPESRIELDFSESVSFYDRLDRLSRSRADRGIELDRAQHRLDGISSEEVREVMERLKSGLSRKAKRGWKRSKETMDWSNVMKDVLNHFHGRLLDLVWVLDQDLENVKEEVNRISYGMMMPYLDMNQDLKLDSLVSFERCVSGFTDDQVEGFGTESDRMLGGAVRGVLRRICKTGLGLYSKTVEGDDDEGTLDEIKGWKVELEDLISWLGWSSEEDCLGGCSAREICMLGMWPVFEWFPPLSRGPKCVKFEDMDGRSNPFPH